MPFQRHELHQRWYRCNGNVRTNLFLRWRRHSSVLAASLTHRQYTTKAALCELLETTVLTVKMNRERLVVALQNKIHVFDLDTMTALHMLKTPPNVEGLMALQPDTSDAQVKERRRGVFPAFPGGTSKGELVLFDVRHLKIVKLIQAHQHPLTAIELSQKLCSNSKHGRHYNSRKFKCTTKLFSINAALDFVSI